MACRLGKTLINKYLARRAIDGCLIALIVFCPGLAQENDFWAETSPTPSEDPQQDDKPADFWSDKASSKPAASDDFWSKSSADEVQRRRQAVLAEEAAERRRVQAERERSRQLAEMERLREEEQRAQLAYQRQRANTRSSNGAGNSGGWRGFAAAAQVFAGTMSAETNKMEAANARNRARQAQLASDAAETRRRQASADRSRRLAELERQAEQAQAAANRADREALAARERQASASASGVANDAMRAGTNRIANNGGVKSGCEIGANWAAEKEAFAAIDARTREKLKNIPAYEYKAISAVTHQAMTEKYAIKEAHYKSCGINTNAVAGSVRE